MPKEKSNLARQLSEKYYTPQEAQHRLGVTRDVFNNHVKRGTIRKQDILGKHGFFLKKEIDALALRIEATFATNRAATLTFRAAVKEDLPAINNIAYLNFGELSRSAERIEARKRFLEVNPNSTFVLVDGNVVVASLDLIPLKHEAILEFREGRRGWTFPSEAIEQFEPGHPLECIIIDMMNTNPAKLGLNTAVVISISGQLAHITDIAEAIAAVDAVVYVGYTTGNADIIALAFFPSNDELTDFMTKTLAAIPGIVRAETNIILKPVRAMFPGATTNLVTHRNQPVSIASRSS